MICVLWRIIDIISIRMVLVYDGTNRLITYLQSFETSESRLKREFETYGPIKRVGIQIIPARG